ncbi:hypothetical protein [Streptomyces nojiriensis]|uniref:hypothetical protein n=1 Tax=Streptomyces nojiriensis TaxID=66374 RepID=UPI0035E29398
MRTTAGQGYPLSFGDYCGDPTPRPGELAAVLTDRGAAVVPAGLSGPGRLAVTGMAAGRVGAPAAGHGIVILELGARRPMLEGVPGALCSGSRTVSAGTGPDGGR